MLWLVVSIVRLEPSLEGDLGLFLTMFDGVVDGERLYVDRWDHKDPLFFWLGGLAFWAFGAHGAALLDALLMLVIGVASRQLAIDRQCAPIPATVVGIGAIGFMTNPAFHATGLTEPPAIALLLGAYVFVGRRRPILALMLVGLIVPLKLAFVLLAMPIVIETVRSRHVSLVKQALALTTPTMLTIGLLALRGELRGWIDSIFFNRTYSQDGPVWFGASSGGIRGHVERFVTVVSESPSLLMSALLLIMAVATIWRLRSNEDPSSGALSAALWLVVTIGLTFLTSHLLRAAVPLLVLVAILLNVKLTSRFSAATALVAIGVLMAVAAGPHPSDVQAVSTIGERWGSIDTASADAVQAMIDQHTPAGEVGLAVSIGPPRDAFLPFLDDRVELVCPTHHLLPWFASRLADHEACIATNAEIVIVGHYSFPKSEPITSHRDRLATLLESGFRQVGVIERPNASDLTIWQRGT